MTQAKNNYWREQVLPVGLTAVVFGLLFLLLHLLILLLNRFGHGAPIALSLSWADVALGMFIYLKTSVDFAIFIGNLIKVNPGYRSRIAVEIGTALGNALGTFLILILWVVFKQLHWLLGIMVFVASLVLLRLAQDGLEHAVDEQGQSAWIKKTAQGLDKLLEKINRIIAPFLKLIIPKVSYSEAMGLKFWPLFGFAFTIPFILGLDDFAGYVPLFSIVNVFGFAAGVMLGHMVLNILLYLSPTKTIKAVSNSLISLLGSVVFVGLAVYGFVEVARLLAG